ncbi:MAG: coenzyme F420-0:L-glutamate ligase [Ignavibacteria bacterium]|nr:coenzyme F420-0:L-glutamate ligase [Ignavibacteria bacterium]
MKRLPSYLGPTAFGIKMGVILPGDDIVEEVWRAVAKCNKDGLLDNNDIICITESVVARAQNNYVTTEEIASEVRERLNLDQGSSLGILYPIASRNRFLTILKGMARAVTGGKVSLQFSYPRDEVGNQIVSENLHKKLKKDLFNDEITFDDLKGRKFFHPATGIDYIVLYDQAIKKEGAVADIFLSNNPTKILNHHPDGVIISSIHEKEKIFKEIKKLYNNCITLQDLCQDRKKLAWSEWGLYGSNMSADDKLKLAPREANMVARKIQLRVMKKTGKRVEAMVWGDGAYKDPSTGIFELADPVCAFGSTSFLENIRRGIKYKFLVDKLLAQGKNRKEIAEIIEKEKRKSYKIDGLSMEGTTPRRLKDVLASLADLVSGSADAGTPLVIIKRFFH